MTEDSKMNRANALRSSVSRGGLLRIALGMFGALAFSLPADAASYYWQSQPGYYGQEYTPPLPRRQQRTRKVPSKKATQVKDTTVHPQMPLIINVSIARQRVRVYDANGFFAEAPVSTGMPGHPTPMGVFSVIQKDRYHHSTIYSGAPMPFMQRITWGGVALHAGYLPGYPASHGCIRMPEAFAIKMWGWTKMGARVIVSPGELTPVSFEHPLLPTMKVAPPPPVAEQPDADEPAAAKADKGAPEEKPIEAKLELRSTVGHSDNLKPDETPLRDETHTAEANESHSNSPMMSDASSASSELAHEADARNKASDASKPADMADDDRTTDKAADNAAKPAEAPDAKSEDKPAEASKVDTPQADAAKADAAKPNTAKPADKPAESAKAANAKKDESRLDDTDKPPKPDARRRVGQLAVFISRKDSKLYVRQNFAPLFDVPVTIAPSERPLGTHVFTAVADKNDPNLLHWTVVTMPMSARAAMRERDEPRRWLRQKGKSARARVAAKPVPLPDSPAEALDRITIPPDVMTRVSAAITSGASIMVSDQGINQGETGEYTDFIVRYW